MINLTHLNGETFFLNAEYIESVESKPDTLITTFNGKKYLVKESCDEVIKRVIEYRRKIMAPDVLTLPKEGD
jgi:flagellar protein FlbD|uniref:Flagellar protein n=1 Tax=Mesoaciditoga lauensis TaxID=1495039 RepID=A0A7V3VT00_9BACT